MSLKPHVKDPLLPQNKNEPFLLTVEFPIFATLFSAALTDGVTYNLLLFRTCTNDLGYTSTTCSMLHLFHNSGEAKRLEVEVQSTITLLVMVLPIVAGITPAVLSLFLGPWSDKHGRKPLIVWPLLGQVLSSCLTVWYSICQSLGAWWLAVCTIPAAILGGNSTFSLGASLLITDLTTDHNRLAILQGCGFTGALLGSASSSYVLSAIGYTRLYIVATGIQLVSYGYSVRFVTESLKDVTEGNFADIFNLSLLNEMRLVCFKRRDGRQATILAFLIIANGLATFCVVGVANMDYFFTRQKFQWLLRDYTIFNAANTVIVIIGLFVGLAIMKDMCHCSDGMLLIMAYLSSAFEDVVRCFATKSWHMYLAGSMSILGGLSSPSVRSQIAKVVSRDEIGKLYALTTCTEAILPVFAPLLFTTIYWKTMTDFPAAIYAVSSGCFTVCVILVTISEILLREEQKHNRS